MNTLDWLMFIAAAIGILVAGIDLVYYNFNLDDILFEKEDK